MTPTKLRSVRNIRLGSDYGSMSLDELQRTRYALFKLADRVEEPAVLLDLAETETFGAAFIGMLADFQKRLRLRRRRLALCNPSAELLQLLHRTKLTDVVDVHRNRLTALRALRQEPLPLGILHLLYPRSAAVLDN